jgi:hypothetical protein
MVKVVLQDGKHLGRLREDEDPVASFLKFGQHLV